ncbi:MAG: phage antirepressor KilAC domain-containing protein [Ruminococcus sp.]|uniref:phage antirepressor KilAC domain-containing protein n=1 Tax=Ruminococcus sp. TaxID=41978 RepID=UPI00344D5C03|nr:phage antirepressor KilAC domain-containing protein [Ruminococcus sp.]
MEHITGQNTRLLETNTVQAKQIEEMQPKVSYHDYVLSAEGLMPISTIAKDYGNVNAFCTVIAGAFSYIFDKFKC